MFYGICIIIRIPAARPRFWGDVLVQGLHSGQLLFRESSQGRELARLDYFSGLQGAAAADPAEGSVYLMSGFGNLYKIKTEWVTSR